MSNYLINGFKKAIAEDKSKWHGVFHYVAVSAVSTIGLGNIWKYPNFSLSCGAGTYLLVYFIVLLILGIPTYCLEIYLGQFVSKGPTRAFELLSPALVGIGWCQAFAAFWTSTYLSAFAALSLVYFLESLRNPLQWSLCSPTWNTTCLTCFNISKHPSYTSNLLSEELYFTREILQIKPNGESGTINNCNIITLVYTWFFVFLMSVNGSKMNKYASYFFALFQCPVLFGLLGRFSHYENAGFGISAQFAINQNMLMSPEIWYDAVTRCVVSLGLGMGTITTLASHNKFYYQAKVTACFLIAIRAITIIAFESILFSAREIVGSRFNNNDISLSIPFLVFVIFPNSLCDLEKGKNTHLALFYAMVFVGTLGAIFGAQIVINRHLQSCFPGMVSWKAALGTTIVGFAISFIYFTPGESWIFDVVNINVNVTTMLILIGFMLLGVNYLYGLQNFCWDAEYMSQGEVGIFWRVCWVIVGPVLVVFALMYILFVETSKCYMGLFGNYSASSQVVAFLLLLCIVAPIPVGITYRTMMCGLASPFRPRNDIPLSGGDATLNTATSSPRNQTTMSGIYPEAGDGNNIGCNGWRPEDEERFADWRAHKRAALERSQMARDRRHVMLLKVLFRKYNS